MNKLIRFGTLDLKGRAASAEKREWGGSTAMHAVNDEVRPHDVPAAGGSYSVGRRIGAFVKVSGQMAPEASGVGSQTREALANVLAVLRETGLGWRDVLAVQVFLAADELFDEFDAAYGEAVPKPRPARTTVSCELAPGALVEIDALAVFEPTAASGTPRHDN